jgi:hypothetical protein
MPPYPPKLINEGETVVLDLKPHWWFFWKHIVAGLALLVVVVLWAGTLGFGNSASKAIISVAIVVTSSSPTGG